eukprot:CAMPEP_0170546576 /NCGR_PEP_ID=MMETSP0211-20121228/4933_1 /TAXON_ID=311385 /ORGANISM="Pseudokeronopsis sp., Strain OXSARD2" /LENGTH=246 /DNA_ID=CAMNT_0010851111 /DNA_START=245 /DNA_END=988 /DNA_ORIENTATION=+
MSRMNDDEVKRKYGNLLPKTGVYFLPDDKIVSFLKILNELRKKYEKEENYVKAKLLKQRFEELSGMEQQRQNINMKQAKKMAHDSGECSESAIFRVQLAWDQYMADYEAAAFESIERLKEKHLLEVNDLHEKVRNNFKIKHKLSKELMDMRKQEKIFFSVKNYDQAERLRIKADFLEQKEKEDAEMQLEEQIAKQEKVLRQRQQMALATLLKRIQRDRDEQMNHRQVDSKRLYQRNSNLLNDMIKK